MPIAPEVWQAPRILYQFARSGLLRELVRATFFYRRQLRDLAADGRRLAEVFPVEIRGLEHIPDEGACLVSANHPRIDVGLGVFYRLAARMEAEKQREIVFLMAAELALWGDVSFPWLQTLLARFQALYPDTIIPVPTIESRPGYRAGRLQATERTRRALQDGQMVIFTPEAETETGNVILPKHIYRYGAGALVKEALCAGIVQLPMAMWVGPDGKTIVRFGEPFAVDLCLTNQETVIEVMAKVAALMPNELRGPFADSAGPAV